MGENFEIFKPGISGIEYIIPPVKNKNGEEETGFKYPDTDGLRIVIHGKAGSGKTLAALQMTISGILNNGKNAIYFTKDSSPENLLGRIIDDYHFFQDQNEELIFHFENNNNLNLIDNTQQIKNLLKNAISFIIEVNGKRIGILLLEKLLNYFADKEGNNDYDEEFDKYFKINEFLIKQFPANINDKNSSENKKKNDIVPVLAFANIESVGNLGIRFNKYSMNINIFRGLSTLFPKYQPVLSFLENNINKYDINKNDESKMNDKEKEELDKYNKRNYFLKRWHEELMIVIDALNSNAVEDCFKLHSQAINYYEKEKNVEKKTNKKPPVTVIVMESDVLTDETAYSYPPDVQIRLNPVGIDTGMRKKTIQILKSRYQEIFDGIYNFLIIDKNRNNMFNVYPIHMKKVMEIICDDNNKKYESVKFFPEGHEKIEKRKTGINILPSFSNINILVKNKFHNRDGTDQRFERDIDFHIDNFNKLVKPEYYAGTGCTLLLTGYKCYSAMFGAHYLFDKVIRKLRYKKNNENKNNKEGVIINSLLLLSFSASIIEVLNGILEYSIFKDILFDYHDSDFKKNDIYSTLYKVLENIKKEKSLGYKNISLYKIKLNVHNKDKDKDKETCGPFLYVLIPELNWYEPEELLEIINDLFNYKCKNEECNHNCHRIDRVLLNRVSDVQNVMPRITEIKSFISGIIELCRLRNIEIMLIDDTGENLYTNGEITSHWLRSAQNVIKLKKVSFRGHGTILIHVIKANNRNVLINRPQELRKVIDFNEDVNKNMLYKLEIQDSFRWFTGIEEGKPEPVKINIDLNYGSKNNPFYKQLKMTKSDLESLMDISSFNLRDPYGRKGFYSALMNLAFIGRDKCHVIDVDEIWLASLLKRKCLSSFNDEHIEVIYKDEKKFNELKKEEDQGKKISNFEKLQLMYVTQAQTISSWINDTPEKQLYAIPYRHNWGVLAINKIKDDYLDVFFTEINGKITPESEKLIRLERMILLLQNKYRETEKKLEDDEINLETIYNKINKLFWKNENTVHGDFITWYELAYFKMNEWDKIYDILKDEVRELRKSNKEQHNKPEFSKVKDDKISYYFHFFNYASVSTESFTSFFIELLLAHLKIDDLFKNISNEHIILKFKFDENEDKIKKAFIQSFRLMYNLLDEKQRLDIIYENNLNLPLDTNLDENKEKHIFFISREWCSTSQIDNIDEMSKSSELRLLPVATKRQNNIGYEYLKFFTKNKEGKHQESKKIEIPENMKNNFKNIGIPVSGSWYLSAISGGNKEVATDIIRGIIYNFHEKERFFRKISPPVKKDLYENDNSESEITDKFIPYMNIIHEFVKNKNTGSSSVKNSLQSLFLDEKKLIFPFSRLLIKNYIDLTQPIYFAIKEAMSFDKTTMHYDFKNEDWENFKHYNNKEVKLEKHISKLINDIKEVQDKE